MGIKGQGSANSRSLALVLGLGLGAAPIQVQAAADSSPTVVQLRTAQVPLAVAGGDESRYMSDRAGDMASGETVRHYDPLDMSDGVGVGADDETVHDPGPANLSDGAGSDRNRANAAGPPPSRTDPETLPLQIAIGLGPSAPGSREELALVRALEVSVAASIAPRTSVRRLHGGGRARSVCRQRRDDLVLTVGYIADREDPVLLAYDCALDRALGIRPSSAAGQSGLVGALWSEHRSLLQQGAKLRRAPLLSRKTRRILIAGGATALLGVALGLILASTLRPTTVVLTVGR